MPDNKNQHYVPRCHLKPFSHARAGVSVNMYNHSHDFIRMRVPIAGQCAKSYFYGRDLVIERSLQQLEGRYATIVRHAEADRKIPEDDVAFLRDFVLLQWCRTDAALRRRREVLQAMDDLAMRGLEHVPRNPPDMSQLALINGSLRVWTDAERDVQDLRVLVLRNLSRVDFVTSDDPAILTNRVYLQRMRDSNFGITSVGALFVMPLGPRRAVVCYDPEAYAAVGRSGCYLNVARDVDVLALNELQYINALSNIYFSGTPLNGEQIRSAFKSVSHKRAFEKFRMWQGVSEGIEGEFECYRKVADGDVLGERTARVQFFAPVYPSPVHWLSVLAMRPKLKGWVLPGAVGGPVREYRAAHNDDMRLVEIGYRPMAHRSGELPERMYHLLSPAKLRERSVRDRAL